MSELGNKLIMADNILYYMRLHGKTRNDLCRDLGFKYSTLSGWLTAEKYPRIDKIEKMANYFQITKADLVEARGSYPRTGGNVIHLAGRDGSHMERVLTDEQMQLFQQLLRQIPDVESL